MWNWECTYSWPRPIPSARPRGKDARSGDRARGVVAPCYVCLHCFGRMRRRDGVVGGRGWWVVTLLLLFWLVRGVDDGDGDVALDGFIP